MAVAYFLPVNVADGHSSRETLTINGTGTVDSKDVAGATTLTSNGTLYLQMVQMEEKHLIIK